MYAKVVGEADCILQELAAVLARGGCGRDDLMFVGKKLKQALLDAEEMYLDADLDEND